MKKSLNYSREPKWVRILLTFFSLIVIFLVSWKIREQKMKKDEERYLKDGTEKKYCSHIHHQIGEIDYYYPFGGWECEYCGELMDGKWIPKDQPFWPTLIPLIKKHLQECKKAQQITNFNDKKKDSNSNYDNEVTLKEKGYYGDEIKNWGLLNKINLPNLKQKNRKGVTKVLSISFLAGEEEKLVSRNVSGRESDLVVFLTPLVDSITYQKFLELLREEKKPDFFYSSHAREELKIYEKLLTSFFIQRILKRGENWNHNVFALEVDEDKFTSFKFKKGIGESGTVSFYLSLLSSYYQKPISRELAASAFLELGNYSKFNYCPWCFQEEVKKNPTENFAKHKISSVNGLKFKVPVALKAGVKKLILSSDQKDDYEQVVPEELRRKLTVYYVKNVEELEKLFLLGEFS